MKIQNYDIEVLEGQVSIRPYGNLGFLPDTSYPIGLWQTSLRVLDLEDMLERYEDAVDNQLLPRLILKNAYGELRGYPIMGMTGGHFDDNETQPYINLVISNDK